MNDFWTTCTTADSADSTTSIKPLDFTEMNRLLAKVKPPPDREFIFDDGMIHGVFKNGELRLSPLFMQIIKDRFKDVAVEVKPPADLTPRFHGIPLIVDDQLPKPAFRIYLPQKYITPAE